jgi:hypothetical protein
LEVVVRRSLKPRNVLALLNSNLVKFFIQSRASLKAGGYYSYFSNVLNQIPIKKVSLTEQKPFIKIVDDIIEAKKKDLKADITALEHQIDKLVHKIYGLTPDEIAIVEEKN